MENEKNDILNYVVGILAFCGVFASNLTSKGFATKSRMAHCMSLKTTTSFAFTLAIALTEG